MGWGEFGATGCVWAGSLVGTVISIVLRLDYDGMVIYEGDDGGAWLGIDVYRLILCHHCGRRKALYRCWHLRSNVHSCVYGSLRAMRALQIFLQAQVLESSRH